VKSPIANLSPFFIWFFVFSLDALLLFFGKTHISDFVQTFTGKSMSFYAFSSVINYMDLHASSAPHSIFLRFLFGLGYLWLSGISRSIAYNWSQPNMKTSVRIILASSCYGKVPVSRKGFFFSTLFSLLSIFFNNLSLFPSAGKRFVKPSKVTKDMYIDRVSPFCLSLISTRFIPFRPI